MTTTPARALLFVAVAGLATSGGCEGAPRRDVASAVAFVDVAVIPMDRERVLEGHTVVVRGDRIVQVGPASEVSIPGDARRLQGSDRYLIPGLIEAHAHVPAPDTGRYLDDVLFLWVANGITTVRGMLGEAGHLELRDRVQRGELLAPSMYLAGPPLGGAVTGAPVESPEDAARRVRTQADAGWDFVKIVPGLTRAQYDAAARTAREVGIPFVGHVPQAVDIVHALESGQQTVEHLDGYVRYLGGETRPVDEEALADIVRRTREAGARVVPTMAVWEVILEVLDPDTVAGYPELRYLPPDLVAGWNGAYRARFAAADPERATRVVENRTRILEALHEGGVPVLLGTDSPQMFSVPGFSLRRELPRMMAAGMTPWEILSSGTRDAGEYLSGEDDFGTIAVGQRADLVVLEANPLDDVMNVTHIDGVMVRGRWVPGEEIRARLEEIAASYAGG